MAAKVETTFHGLLGQNKKHRSMTGLRQAIDIQRSNSKGKSSVEDVNNSPLLKQPSGITILSVKKVESKKDPKYGSKRKNHLIQSCGFVLKTLSYPMPSLKLKNGVSN